MKNRQNTLKDFKIKVYEGIEYINPEVDYSPDPDATFNEPILKRIITTFFNSELVENQRYFLLLKVQVGEYGWKTFHHGIITSRSYCNNYIEFVNSKLLTSGEHYKNENTYERVAFQYFTIPKERWEQFPEDKWVHISRNPGETIKMSDFHRKYNIPLNIDYQTWGTVTLSTNQVLIIEGKTNYTVNLDKELNINRIFTDKIKFTDHILLNGQYIKRCFNDFTYYIDLTLEKVVFTINKLETEYLEPTSDNPFKEKMEKVEARNLDRLMNPKIGTFDIETTVKNGVHSSYLYSFYDGFSTYSFFADKPGDKT